MSTKYTKIFSIPDATSTVLTDLTRNLLRASTYSNDINDLGDLYAFSYQHFMDALDARNGAFDEEEMGGGKMSNDELIERVTFLFDQADADGNGYLDRQEFKEVFKSLKNELGLSNKMVKQIMAEADENDDGVIEYKEFVPIAVDVINVLEAKQDFEAQKAMDAEDAVEDAKDFLLHGMPRETLEEMLKTAFLKADKDKSGYLDRKEFKDCLKGSGLGFTKKEINIMMSEVDLDGDGRITYQEFVPMCFNMLADMMAEKMGAVSSENEEAIKGYLVELFEELAGDLRGGRVEGEPRSTWVDKSVAVNVLRDGDLGLTRIQIAAIMSEIDIDKHGSLDYLKLVDACAGVMNSLGNVERQRMQADKVSDMRKQEDYGLVLGYTQDQMRAALDDGFRAADGDESGLLQIDRVAEVVVAVIELNQQQLQAVMSLAAPDDEGNCWYDDVSDWAFHTLEYLVSGQHANMSPRD